MIINDFLTKVKQNKYLRNAYKHKGFTIKNTILIFLIIDIYHFLKT